MKITNKITVAFVAAALSLSSLAGAQEKLTYGQQLQTLQNDAKADSGKTITAISNELYKLVKQNPSQMASVVSSVLAQRSSWSEAELYSICRAGLVAAPEVYQALKTAAHDTDTEVLHEHGIKAATLKGKGLVSFWKEVSATLSTSAAGGLFNKVMTRLATDGVSFVKSSTYGLGILDTISIGEGDDAGEGEFSPLFPPVTEGK